MRKAVLSGTVFCIHKIIMPCSPAGFGSQWNICEAIALLTSPSPYLHKVTTLRSKTQEPSESLRTLRVSVNPAGKLGEQTQRGVKRKKEARTLCRDCACSSDTALSRRSAKVQKRLPKAHARPGPRPFPSARARARPCGSETEAERRKWRLLRLGRLRERGCRC